MELTRQDIEQLLTCIDAWEAEPSKDGLSGMLLGTMLGKLSNLSKEDSRTEIMGEMNTTNAAVKKRKEQAVFLRAKLIQMRNRMQERENVNMEA